MLSRLAIGLGTGLVLLALVAVTNAYRRTSLQIDVPPADHVKVDETRAAGRLAGAVRIRTVSRDDAPDASAAEFLGFHRYLQDSFPLTHRTLEREVVGAYSLLYTWPGTDPAAKAIMLMAHADVVPIAEGTEKDWGVPPFDGIIKDGYIWGRGAWDNKGNLFSIMEAVERLVAEGFRPRQTVYIVSGHDEEVGGERGARQIAELLQSRSVRLDFVVDEGTLITEGILKGIDRPVALIGVAEKGVMTLSLSTQDEPGHASMPPHKGAIGVLGDAVARLERTPMPAAIGGVAADMLQTLAPEMRGAGRVLLSNLWLFEPLVRRELEKSKGSNAFLRTTAALTVFRSGNKVNVVPAHAEAFVNVRLLPGDTQEEAIQHVRDVIGNPAVKVRRVGAASEASPISASDSAAYRLLSMTIREVFPNTIVAPGLMVAATDSRHLQPIADHVYRFSPVRTGPEDLARFHGTNERISIRNYVGMITFYHRLIRSAAGPDQR